MKRFVNSKPAMIGVLLVIGLALIATMNWTYSVGVSTERVIAMLCMVGGLIAAGMQLGRITKGRPVD